MGKTKTKFFGLAVMLVLIVALAAAFGLGIFRTSAAEWDGETLDGDYKTGMQIDIPEKTVSDGNTSVTAQSVLIYPDGNATVDTQVSLPMSGIYKVIYTAEINGKVYKTEESFTVRDGLYSVSSAASSITYGKHPNSKETEGLIVRLAEGDTLTFNKIIDVSKVTSSDALIEMFVTPDVIGTMDFSRLTVILTDVEDPSCTLQISGKQSSDGINYPWTYFLAGGNNQPRTGLEGNGILHVNNQWGRAVQHSFYGKYSDTPENELDKYKLSFRYDAASVSAYINGQFIIDMDSFNYFDELWMGFTSSRVRISVMAEEYLSDSANFVISYVKDMELTDTEVVDTAAPELTIHTEYGSAPEAKVGMPYPVPEASAKDDYSGECSVKTSIWYNYGADNAVLVDFADGKFVPKYEGTYGIMYESSDRSGNTSTEVILVTARKEVAPIVITLPENPQTEGKAGSFVEVKEAVYAGGCGNLELIMTAKCGDETYAIEEGGFYPEREGKYEVIYTVTDYIGQVSSESYEVTVSKGGVPVFREKPDLPRVFISGSEYVFPTCYALDYSSGSAKRVEAELSVTDAKGTHNIEAGSKFAPIVENNLDTIIISYRAGETEAKYSVPCVVPFVTEEDEIPRLRIDNYMLKDGVSVERADTSVRITADRSDGCWSFARELIAENFETELRAVKGQNNFEALRLTLTDMKDPSVSFTAKFINDGDCMRLELNGTIIELTSSFIDMGTMVIGYRNGNLSIGSTKVAVSKTDSGAAFEGFPSKWLYFELAFEGAEANDAYDFVSLNGQPFSNASSDRIRPRIVVLGSTGGSRSIGSQVTIPAAMAGDVLDPVIKFYLTVNDPQGNPISDINGQKLENVDPSLEYTFTVEQYGQYNVVYTAMDTFNGREENYNYVINVEDETAPEIVLNGEIPSTAKKGETVLIPTYTLSDNCDDAENLIVIRYLYTPDGILVEIPEESNAVRLSYEGKYEIRFMVVDAAGNICLVKYIVTVNAV